MGLCARAHKSPGSTSPTNRLTGTTPSQHAQRTLPEPSGLQRKRPRYLRTSNKMSGSPQPGESSICAVRAIAAPPLPRAAKIGKGPNGDAWKFRPTQAKEFRRKVNGRAAALHSIRTSVLAASEYDERNKNRRRVLRKTFGASLEPYAGTCSCQIR